MDSNYELIDQFLKWVLAMKSPATHESFKYALYRFKGWLFEHELNILSLTPKDIAKYPIWLQNQGLKPSTMSHYVVVVRSFWRWLELNDKAPFSIQLITSVPPRGKQSYPALTEGEFEAMVSRLSRYELKDIRDHAILCLLWASGMRLGELCSLNRGDIAFEDRKATVATYKRLNHKREVYWDEKTNLILKDWDDARTHYMAKHDIVEDAFFLSLSCGFRGNRIYPDAIQKLVRDLRARCHFHRPITVHSFRHGFGTRAMRNNVNIRYLQEMMGHAKLNTTMIYMQATNKDVEHEYRKVMEHYEKS